MQKLLPEKKREKNEKKLKGEMKLELEMKDEVEVKVEVEKMMVTPGGVVILKAPEHLLKKSVLAGTPKGIRNSQGTMKNGIENKAVATEETGGGVRTNQKRVEIAETVAGVGIGVRARVIGVGIEARAVIDLDDHLKKRGGNQETERRYEKMETVKTRTMKALKREKTLMPWKAKINQRKGVKRMMQQIMKYSKIILQQ